MIEITNKENCCGCSACYSICPKNCIKMTADDEGFLYPKIDISKCIGCGMCEKVCPEKNVLPDTEKEQWAYLAQNKDEIVREESTSGGAFTVIAEYVIENGGVVFGVAFDENLTVQHMYVENKEELYKFRNSKYVQSNVGNCFKEVKKFLDEGRFVCFSGTPCQIEGLHCFLKKEYANLILVDIVCHAVPSPLVWRKYLELYKDKYNVTNIKFRDKKMYGYKYSTMSLYNNNTCLKYSGVESDKMLRAFFSDICDRPSCYSCSFKKRYRVSDFTIWDCFEIEKFSEELDDNKGTTRILIQSKKGYDIFNNIKNNFKSVEVSPDSLIAGVREMFYSINGNSEREAFMNDAEKMSGEELFNKYFPDNVKVKIERAVRKLLVNTKYYNKIKRLAKKMLKK